MFKRTSSYPLLCSLQTGGQHRSLQGKGFCVCKTLDTASQKPLCMKERTGSTPRCSDSALRQLWNGTENCTTWKFISSSSVCKGSGGNAQLRVPGKAETCTELPTYCETSWELCVLPHPYVEHTGSKRASKCQRSFQAPPLGILSSVLCSLNKTHRISAFSLSFFHTEEGLQPKRKLLLEWKEHRLFRTCKSVFLQTHIKGR